MLDKGNNNFEFRKGRNVVVRDFIIKLLCSNFLNKAVNVYVCYEITHKLSYKIKSMHVSTSFSKFHYLFN